MESKNEIIAEQKISKNIWSSRTSSPLTAIDGVDPVKRQDRQVARPFRPLEVDDVLHFEAFRAY